MGHWIDNSPVSRGPNPIDTPTKTKIEGRTPSTKFQRLNNLTNSFRAKNNYDDDDHCGVLDLGCPGGNGPVINKISLHNVNNNPHSMHIRRHESGLDVLRKLSPFKTKKRKLFADEEKFTGPEVKVRVIDTTVLQDTDLFHKVMDATMLIGWGHNNSNRFHRKQLIYEDKKCEKVDLEFGVDLRDLEVDTCEPDWIHMSAFSRDHDDLPDGVISLNSSFTSSSSLGSLIL